MCILPGVLPKVTFIFAHFISSLVAMVTPKHFIVSSNNINEISVFSVVYIARLLY